MGDRTLFDDDGNEVIVPDEEEITSLKESSEKVEGLEGDLKKNKEMIEELEKGANPNWKEVREEKKRMKATIEALKAQGKDIDKDGKIIDAPQPVTPDDTTKIATEATKKVLLDNELDKALSQLPEDKRSQVKEVYEKLTTGVEVNLGSFQNHFESAARASGIEKPVDPVRQAVISQGGSPRVNKEDGDLNQGQRQVAGNLGITEDDLKKYNK